MDLKFSIVDHTDYTIEEQGNQFTALRKIRWGDSDKEFLELRRWRNQPDGTEFPLKGVTFMTEDGPSELVNTLVDMGYGETKQVLSKLSTRENFRRSLNTVLGKEDEFYEESVGSDEDDYYDPKQLLGNI